jgi:hypothetical protein
LNALPRESRVAKLAHVPLFRLRKIETISGNRKSGAVRLWALAENVSEVAPRGLLPCRHEP